MAEYEFFWKGRTVVSYARNPVPPGNQLKIDLICWKVHNKKFYLLNKFKIFENLDMENIVQVYSDYLKKPQNIDVNYQTNFFLTALRIIRTIPKRCWGEYYEHCGLFQHRFVRSARIARREPSKMVSPFVQRRRASLHCQAPRPIVRRVAKYNQFFIPV